MGKRVILVGTQWGDEGKGKVVDLLTAAAKVVVRFQGGHNAGHTVVVGEQQIILHLLPSGAVRPGVSCVIGNGVVVSPRALLDEIQTVEDRGYDIRQRLYLSAACPLILSYHVAIDQAREALRGDKRIGTTGRGIGPAYEDKVARRALRLGDLADPARVHAHVEEVGGYHNFLLRHYYKVKPVDLAAIEAELLEQSRDLLSLMSDVTDMLATHAAQGSAMLFEGAQGALLDIDHGTYPFVTSSNTCAATASSGSGFPITGFNRVVGVAKAYTTRVGSGPFPTELFDDVGRHLTEVGAEFGATTGRRRRCGWFDVVAMRRACRQNGIDGLCITKLDVFDGLEELKICVGHGEYGDPGVWPYPAADACQPEYEILPGWTQCSAGVTDIEKLPENARSYLRRIEDLVGIPIDIISTGAERSQTIVLRHPFDG